MTATIAGGTRKNIARYMNHACRPNTVPRRVGNRIYTPPSKPIKAGQEIICNYGKEYAQNIHPSSLPLPDLRETQNSIQLIVN